MDLNHRRQSHLVYSQTRLSTSVHLQKVAGGICTRNDLCHRQALYIELRPQYP